jgi:O-antigen/teichoic acid export membrane protein
MLGTALGQGILVLAAPLLTRLYTAADFGALTVCTSVIAILSVVSTLRLEVAVPLPTSDTEAAAVAWAGIYSAGCAGIIVAVVGAAFGGPISQALGSPVLGSLWWLIAFTTFVVGVNQILATWMTRERRYTALGVRNFAAGTGQLAAQAGLGIAGVRPLGLIVGLAAGHLAGSGGLLSRRGLIRQGQPTWQQVRCALVRYKKFPLLSTWSGLLNSLGMQAPLLIISTHYGLATVGLIGITIRVLGVPVATIGQAVASLYRGEASARIRDGSPSLHRSLRNAAAGLLIIGLIPTATLALFGHSLFGFIFGAQWADSGTYAGILSVGYLAQLATSPISQTLLLLERQDQQLAWDVTRLAVTVGGLSACVVSDQSIATTLAVLSATQVVSYVALYALCAYAAANHDARVGASDGQSSHGRRSVRL